MRFEYRRMPLFWFANQTQHVGLVLRPVFLLDSCPLLPSSPAPCGETRPADQTAREAGLGGRGSGPAGGPGLAETPSHERDHCKFNYCSDSKPFYLFQEPPH